MIYVDSVNEQVKYYAPRYEVFEFQNKLTIFEIQYQLPGFVEKDYYTIIKRKDMETYPYIKINKFSDLLEIYPSVNANWMFTNTIPSCWQKINPIEHHPETLPYGSYNVEDKIVDNIYYIKSNDISIIYRTNLKGELNRTYHRFTQNEFHNVEFLNKEDKNFLEKSGAGHAIFYFDLNYQPTAVLLSWSVFNEKFDKICFNRVRENNIHY